jgi:hypothetical protein
LDGGSARRKISTYTKQHKHRINAHKHPFLEWDSNPRLQRSSERRQFMPQTARPLWSESVRASEDSSCLKQRGHWDRRAMSAVPIFSLSLERALYLYKSFNRFAVISKESKLIRSSYCLCMFSLCLSRSELLNELCDYHETRISITPLQTTPHFNFRSSVVTTGHIHEMIS